MARPEAPEDSAYSCARLSDGAITAFRFVVRDGLVVRWSGSVARATATGITKETVRGALDPLIAMLAGPDSAKIRSALTSELASASGSGSPMSQGEAFQFRMKAKAAEKPAYARAEINAVPTKPSPSELVDRLMTSKETTLNVMKLKEALVDAGFFCSGLDGAPVVTADCSGPLKIASETYKEKLSKFAITVALGGQSDAATALSPLSAVLKSTLSGPGSTLVDVITDRLKPGALALEEVGDLLVAIDALDANQVQIDVLL